jgi:hypothetical protein
VRGVERGWALRGCRVGETKDDTQVHCLVNRYVKYELREFKLSIWDYYMEALSVR